MKKFIRFSISILILFILIYFLWPDKKLPILFLTWDNEDTSHTMTINYLSSIPSQTATVYYDLTPHNGDFEKYRYKAEGEIRTYPGVEFNVHSVHLGGLNPKQNYYFIAGDESTGFSNEKKFRTIPEAGLLNFISGGDASVSKSFEDICKIAAHSNPYFAIIGGDIAYADGKITSQALWIKLLKIWDDIMVTTEGYTIPLIAAIGNHEINNSNYLPTQTIWDKAPFYYMLFHPADDKTFFKRKLGNHSILFVLDTDHIYASDGEQLNWMNENLSHYTNAAFRFASYHVPLYPSYRDPDAKAHVTLRKNWLSAFDQHHLDIAFENHEHALKKSKLLKNNKVSSTQGTYYIGDGDWGTNSFIPVKRWYVEISKPVNHAWSVTLNENTATFKALTIDGIDETYSFAIKARDNGTTQ